MKALNLERKWFASVSSLFAFEKFIVKFCKGPHRLHRYQAKASLLARSKLRPYNLILFYGIITITFRHFVE